MTEEEQKPVEWLEDADQGLDPSAVYIKPNLEMKLTDKQKSSCREIVQEIKKFGVNQRQLMFLLDLLVLELENMDSVRRLRGALRAEREELVEEKKSDLILGSSDLDL